MSMTASPRRARRARTSLPVRAPIAALVLFVVCGAHATVGAQEAPPTCNGSPATVYVQDGSIVGGPNDGQRYRRVLRGTAGDDVIVGTDGSDRIKGLAGRDAICGGGGRDEIAAGDGDDVIDGGPGNDTIKGQAERDTIDGGDGDDRIVGGAGDDRIDGGAGTNRIKAGAGSDTCANGATATSCVASVATLTITNDLPASTVCPIGNTLSVFAPGQQVVQPGGGSVTLHGDFSQFPGVGIQVNNWYWTSVSLPVQTGPPQNPDNSGAQFAVSAECVLSQEPAWFGKGIPTSLIAAVTAAKTGDGCRITVAQSSYTDAVTPGCCAPPGIGSGTCTGPWGVTNDHQPWPPG
jgi:Ca2+-binding RTX toxin-like protein